MKRLVSPVQLLSVVIGVGLIVQVSWAEKPSSVDENTAQTVRGAVAQLGFAGWGLNTETSGAAFAALPDSTSVDDVEWVEHVLHVNLTLPMGAMPLTLSPLDMERISGGIGEPFRDDPEFAGVVVRVRTDEGAPYRALEEFVEYAAPPCLLGSEVLGVQGRTSKISGRELSLYDDGRCAWEGYASPGFRQTEPGIVRWPDAIVRGENQDKGTRNGVTVHSRNNRFRGSIEPTNEAIQQREKFPLFLWSIRWDGSQVESTGEE